MCVSLVKCFVFISHRNHYKAELRYCTRLMNYHTYIYIYIYMDTCHMTRSPSLYHRGFCLPDTMLHNSKRTPLNALYGFPRAQTLYVDGGDP